MWGSGERRVEGGGERQCLRNVRRGLIWTTVPGRRSRGCESRCLTTRKVTQKEMNNSIFPEDLSRSGSPQPVSLRVWGAANEDTRSTSYAGSRPHEEEGRKVVAEPLAKFIKVLPCLASHWQCPLCAAVYGAVY